MAYHYWDNNFRTKEGKTLQECFDTYGTGTDRIPKSPPTAQYDVIFLDETRDFGYSWMLQCYDRATNRNAPVNMYEMNRVPGRHPVNKLRKKKEPKSTVQKKTNSDANSDISSLD